MKLNYNCLLFFLISFLFFGFKIQDSKPTHKAKKYFDRRAKKNRFNGVVLVQKNGVIFKKAYGYSDFDKKTKLNVNSVFQLASVSKPFTATAILMLIEKGKLKYNTKVTDIIPNFPYKGRTIKNLLNHKSGLPNYIYFVEQKKIWSDRSKTLTNKALLDILIQKKPLAYFSPNKRHYYCNTNYFLLATIIEKVSKQSFAKFMQKNIFTPLKMKSTFVYSNSNAKNHKNKTKGFKNRRRRYNTHYLDGVIGDKGIYSTVYDLLKFHNGLINHKLLSKKTLQKAYTPTAKKGRYKYGYGWRSMKTGGKNLIYHNGWWRGYKNYFVRHKKDVIIILSNSIYGSSFRLKDLVKLI